MSAKGPKITDPYIAPLKALDNLRPASGLTIVETAVAISDGLKKWDYESHGDWRDALAVAARRKDLRVRSPFALLAQYLLQLDFRRAAEVGKLVEKTPDRHPHVIPTIVSKAGGLKKATAASFAPPPKRTIRVRRRG